LILPFYHRLRSFDLMQSVAHLSRGQSLFAPTVGMTGEYVGSREYQPGLAVRKWDYASWARLGQPVVREFCEPRHPSVAVMLDTFFPGGNAEDGRVVPELEAVLSLAAAIVEALFSGAYTLNVLTVGDHMFASDSRFAAGNHLVVLEHLALARPCDKTPFSELMERLERFPITWDLAIVLSHRWGVEQERLFQLVTRQHAAGVRVVVGGGGRFGESVGPDAVRRIRISRIQAGEVDL
jgi:uncharacterized protein (DUF58 family)